MVDLSRDMVTWKMSTPALKLQISVPVFNLQRRMVLSRDPDTTISLSGEMAQHHTCMETNRVYLDWVDFHWKQPQWHTHPTRSEVGLHFHWK